VERNQGPLNAASIRRIFGTILAESRRLQHTLGAEAK
jgi:chorismate mutase